MAAAGVRSGAKQVSMGQSSGGSPKVALRQHGAKNDEHQKIVGAALHPLYYGIIACQRKKITSQLLAMTKIICFFIFFLFLANPSYGQNEKFRMDYNYVASYDTQSKEWDDWKEGYNTFVLNYNENNDILHIKGNGNKVIYRKLSGVEEGTTSTGKHYQILRALDEDGNAFRFQMFDDPEIGAKMMYSNFAIQFSKQ